MLRSLRRKLVPFALRVDYFRLKRSVHLLCGKNDYALTKTTSPDRYPYLVFSAESVLLRDYPEPWYSLQYNKIDNINLAMAKIDGTVLGPGRLFSFWRLVGKTTAGRGYKDGMTIIDGTVRASMGGGLCQLSNALFWTALHAGFRITERHRHSFDIFPDTNRTVPFGSGATVFYNYIDLGFENTTDLEYLVRVRLSEKKLHVEIFAEKEPHYAYSIVEENHGFIVEETKTYRVNELYRLTKDRKGNVLYKELVCKNKGLVLYGRNDETMVS